MKKIEPSFSRELMKYGADNFQACYNCGNCTAVCNLSDKSAAFPRILVRYGLLGMKKELVGSMEPWLCYSCGDCSETCPRKADPDQFMAALRRYIIAQYEPSGLTKLIFKSNVFAVIFMLLLSVLLGMFLFTLQPDHEVARWLFRVLPFDVIHDMGMVIFALTGITVFIGIISMSRHLSASFGKAVEKNRVLATIVKVLNEMMTLKRYQTCDKEEDSYWKSKPELLKPWFIHWSVMWGFIGLLAATVLDFILKDPATNIWWPSRILGTVAGIFLVYGTTVAIMYRIKKVTKAYSSTRLADWLFLVFLWLAGLTGFWLEISVALNADNLINHLVLLIHTIISMELVLLFSFSKFSHAIYRPLALYFLYRQKT